MCSVLTEKNNGEIALPACKFGKFEIGRGLFENFGKLEEQSSKILEIGKFEAFQMNEALKFFYCQMLYPKVS